MTNYISIFITVPEEQMAKEIALSLTESGLIACAQVEGPIKSFYQWNGELQQDIEYRLVLKALSSRYTEIENAVVTKHSYDVPQIIAIPIIEGYRPYFDWIDDVSSK